jgi:6-pyruvoyltetrahydropterin/6-carboxytetrahydropterin synthase
VTFAAGYRYENSLLSASENRMAYGSLYRDPLTGAGFGANFRVEAHFEGEPDPLTGMIANLTEIDQWLHDVIGDFDHQLLNDLEAFKSLPVTPEKIAYIIFENVTARVQSVRDDVHLVKIRLYQGDADWVECFV